MVATGREPHRRQVDTVARGMVTYLGRNRVEVLTACSRIGWSYVQRVCVADFWVSSIDKASAPSRLIEPTNASMILGPSMLRTLCVKCLRTQLRHLRAPLEAVPLAGRRRFPESRRQRENFVEERLHCRLVGSVPAA